MIATAKIKAKKLLRQTYRHFCKFMGAPKDKTTRNLFRLFQAALYAFLTILFLSLIVLLCEDGPGATGDFFGGFLNPTLTFITFMGLLVTIVLQNKELKESREEAKRSADALSAQSATMQDQLFDQSFFNMLSLHQDIVNSIELKDHPGPNASHKGRDAINKIYMIFKSVYLNQASEVDSALRIEQSWKRYWLDNQAKLNHYFRSLESIILTIENTSAHKTKYVNLVKSQLSNQELCIIFYYGLSIEGENLKPQLNRYKIFQHLPKNLLIDGSHAQFYASNAF